MTASCMLKNMLYITAWKSFVEIILYTFLSKLELRTLQEINIEYNSPLKISTLALVCFPDSLPLQSFE